MNNLDKKVNYRPAYVTISNALGNMQRQNMFIVYFVF